MTRGRTTSWSTAALASGLLLLMWAAAAGPVGVLSPSGRELEFQPPPPAPAPVDSGGTTENLRERTRDVEQTLDLSWLGELVVWAVFLAFTVGLVLGLRYLWRNRRRSPERPVDVEFVVLPETAVVERLRDDVASQVAAVQEGSPRNGIVRCWLRLEEVVAEAGLPRHPWETSAEYTVRILRTIDLDPHAIGELSRLYREARFSEHELDEQARTRAGTALRQLHSDLQEVR